MSRRRRRYRVRVFPPECRRAASSTNDRCAADFPAPVWRSAAASLSSARILAVISATKSSLTLCGADAFAVSGRGGTGVSIDGCRVFAAKSGPACCCAARTSARRRRAAISAAAASSSARCRTEISAIALLTAASRSSRSWLGDDVLAAAPRSRKGPPRPVFSSRNASSSGGHVSSSAPPGRCRLVSRRWRCSSRLLNRTRCGGRSSASPVRVHAPASRRGMDSSGSAENRSPH